MELRQLAYFVAVAEESSFTRAAAREHVAQPGVSAQIRQLERELGEPLLDRSGRSVRLTEAGSAVLPHAQAALAEVSSARLAVDELRGLIRGRVAVGTVGSCTAVHLPDVLADFYHDHPGVEVTLWEATSAELTEAVGAGRLDLALVGLAGQAPDGLDAEVLADEPLVAVVRPGDPLAGARSTTLAALGGRALISLPLGTGLRSSLDDGCAAAGLRPRIALEASDPEVIAELAGRGLGVAILPRSTAAAHDRLVAVPITEPELRARLALIWRSAGPASPAARALVSRARLLAGPR
jgi:DNA-binding transcriptional LysR family regulator